MANHRVQKHEKYSYIGGITWPIRILFIVSIGIWLSVLKGYISLFIDHPWYGIYFAPIALFLSGFFIISLFINTFYKKFDLEAHNKLKYLFFGYRSAPTVDIFLPVAGEPIEVVSNTWRGVKELNYSNYKVYVLDDKGSEEYKALALKLGFNYLSRPNKGELKKAGNLKFGFSRTRGEFIVILDADFRPHPDFILELLPHMHDEKVGIVQSPQYFDVNKDIAKRSWLEYGAGNIQTYFYKWIEVSRGRFGGSICVGSNAIYRRSALEMIGGTAQKDHSEDVWTGFKLLTKGWKVKYVPLVLAKGTCPDDLQAFFKQQNRWCSGSMSLMTSKEFWLSSVPIYTKMCFISGFMFYISSLLLILVPFNAFNLLWFHAQVIESWNFYIFLVSSLVSLSLMGLLVYRHARAGTLLAHCAAAWGYSYAIISKIARKTDPWVATGAAQGLSASFRFLTRSVFLYVILYYSLVAITIAFAPVDWSDIQMIPVIFWMAVAASAHTLYAGALARYITKRGWWTAVLPSINLSQHLHVFRSVTRSAFSIFF